jgi:hypothetical protein
MQNQCNQHLLKISMIQFSFVRPFLELSIGAKREKSFRCKSKLLRASPKKWLCYKNFRFSTSTVLFEKEDNFFRSRLTRWVCEKIAQNVAQPISYQNQYITLRVEKRSPWIYATRVISEKHCPKKKLPNSRKFAQSGHPVPKPTFSLAEGREKEDIRNNWQCKFAIKGTI